MEPLIVHSATSSLENPMNPVQKRQVVVAAQSYAADGFLCSEAVLLATSRWLGLKSDLIPRIATGFGAGICYRGSVCGALSGGIMALSLQFGRDDPKTKTTRLFQAGQKLITQFKREYGSVECSALTDCDIQTERGRKKYAMKNLWEASCRQYIGNVTAMVVDLLGTKAPATLPCKDST
jgi:C_GCAxxG_C_C family probable redox protein